jgi:hypothetical protein
MDLLCHGAGPGCQGAVARAPVAHDFVNVSRGQQITRQAAGAIRVQNVNGYHSRFRGWLPGFRGVATRY